MLCVYSVFVAICNTRNSLTTKRHAPPRLGASLRSRLRVSLCSLATPWLAGPWGFASSLATPSLAPLSVGLRCVASLRRSGLNFHFYATPGFRGFAAPPPGYFIAPLWGSNLGSLTLAKIPPPSPLQLPTYRAEANLAYLRREEEKILRFFSGLRELTAQNNSTQAMVSKPAWLQYPFCMSPHTWFRA